MSFFCGYCKKTSPHAISHCHHCGRGACCEEPLPPPETLLPVPRIEVQKPQPQFVWICPKTGTSLIPAVIMLQFFNYTGLVAKSFASSDRALEALRKNDAALQAYARAKFGVSKDVPVIKV